MQNLFSYCTPKKTRNDTGKSTILNINPNPKFAAKRSDRNLILRACGEHSHEPVQVEMASGETGNLLHLPTRIVNFLKQKNWPIRSHQNIGGFTAKWRRRDPPHHKSTDTNYFGHRQENELWKSCLASLKWNFLKITKNARNICDINVNIYFWYRWKIKHMIPFKIRTVPLSERVLRKILV